MKKIKVLCNAIGNNENIQAQNRDFIEWISNCKNPLILFYIFYSTSKHKEIEELKNVVFIKVSRNRYLRSIQIIIYNFLSFDKRVIITNVVPYLNILLVYYKYIFPSRVYIGFVNRLPYINSIFKIMCYHKFNHFGISKAICDDFFELNGKIIPLVRLSYNLDIFNSKNDNIEKLERIRFISVGSLQWRKNPILFTSLALRFPKHDFVWIGDGELDFIVKRNIKKNNISNFAIYPSMNQLKIANYLKKSDFLCLFSYLEGYPNVIAESLLSGTPVLTFNHYDPENIINDFNGYVFKDEFEIFEFINKIDREYINKLKKNTRDNISIIIKDFDEFSIDKLFCK